MSNDPNNVTTLGTGTTACSVTDGAPPPLNLATDAPAAIMVGGEHVPLLAVLSRAHAALARLRFDEFVAAMGDTARTINGNGYIRGEWARFTLSPVAYVVGCDPAKGDAILAAALAKGVAT